MLEVMLIDDEAAGRRALREYCEAEADLRLVGEYCDGHAALEAIRRAPPHLIFLDIKMESMDGIALVRSLARRTPPLVVFVTAYEQYAAEAFELSALDYLLKPFDRERFTDTLQRVRERVAVQSASQRSEALQAAIEKLAHERERQRDARPRMLVGIGPAQRLLDIQLIEAVKADRNYVQLIVGRESITVRDTLQQMERKLQILSLLRVSRSWLVNLNQVREISRTLRGDWILVLAGGTIVTSSESQREAVRRGLERFKTPPE
ncbi:MAG: LytR/AlgR family response regulator transcription factor [Steroidobacteraceae bacterium]